MSQYQSLTAALNPSMSKKVVGFFMVLLAFLWLIFKSTHGGIILFDYFYAGLFFLLGMMKNIEGRGYRILRKTYVLVEEERFEIKTDIVKYSVIWDAIKKIDFLTSVIIITLNNDEEKHIKLTHLNPDCVVYLQELFSVETTKRHIDITFYQ